MVIKPLKPIVVAACIGSMVAMTGVVTQGDIVGVPAVHAGEQQAGIVTGQVLETRNAPGYTYIFVKNAMAEQWVAVPQSEVKVGDTVNYVQGMVMENFPSKSLNRTFEKIVFSEGLVDDIVAEGHGAEKISKESDAFANAIEKEKNSDGGDILEDNPDGSSGAITSMQNITVEKVTGENGYTVGEIFEQAKSLNSKTVRVRGKVIKINMNIMGRHWIHLQDGTGDPMTNSHDLVITSTETLQEDSVVVLEGVVAADKDFGAGYKYAVLLENATVIAE